MTRIPLAWKNLTHDLRRLSVAVSGIAFAVLLMFQQRGFNHALFDSTVALLESLDGDLVVHNRARFALSSELRFDRRLLDVVQSDPAVVRAQAVYLENTMARLRRSGNRARPIRVIGVDAANPPMLDPQARRDVQQLALRSDSVLMDSRSKRNFGFDLSLDAGQVSGNAAQSGELAGRQIEVVGTFSMGRDFAHEGNLLIPATRLAEYFPYRAADPLSVVDLGLVQLQSGADVDQASARIQEMLGPSVTVLPRRELIRREIAFWARSTPIGTIFAVGAIMGFVVGVVICYQVLATDIADHMSEFATLRAMGYRNGYFFRMVFSQSVILSLLGFLPGMTASWFLFRFVSSQTGLLMMMTWDRALFIFVLTVLMCVISGALALRKLLAADPASLF